jgi:NAD(P)-dependent dehydrogenase (short-subunit alcohol dehydrogenase family)
MSAESIAERTTPTVTGLSSRFMLDGATYVVGGHAGFEGMDFYAAGRGGVLGDVSADLVAASFVFFNPDVVRAAWDGSRSVMSRTEAAQLFAGCLVTWAGEHLGDDVDWARLVELAGRIVDSASIGGAPMFAAWRDLPVPTDPKAAALHQLNALRELRNARHGAAVTAVGLDVGDAVRHKSPHMAPAFGWEGNEVGPEVPALWDEAEALTNRATDGDYAVLDDAEADEFVALCAAASASVH